MFFSNMPVECRFGTGLVRIQRAVPILGPPDRHHYRESPMLHYAIIFFVVALIAAVLGFGGIAGAAAGVAKILFFVFLILFVVSLVVGRRPPV
jgi:uncharacterized membrane protein YtjA (UPF0391 family)